MLSFSRDSGQQAKSHKGTTIAIENKKLRKTLQPLKMINFKIFF